MFDRRLNRRNVHRVYEESFKFNFNFSFITAGKKIPKRHNKLPINQNHS